MIPSNFDCVPETVDFIMSFLKLVFIQYSFEPITAVVSVFTLISLYISYTLTCCTIFVISYCIYKQDHLFFWNIIIGIFIQVSGRCLNSPSLCAPELKRCSTKQKGQLATMVHRLQICHTGY